MPFCADFGPFNLGMAHQFCEVLKELMGSPKLHKMKIVYYTSTAANDTTNAIFLLGTFLVLHLGASPDDAWQPFCNLNGAVKCYRDATFVPSPYDLHVKDCWAGFAKAVATRLYDPADFDEDEYFYYDHPSNGDMHEVVTGKFFAFKGPTGRRKALGFGRYTLIPSDYFDVFRVKNIRTVVRLNSKEYDRSSLVQAGFNHYDLFFTDCSTPSDAIVDKFLKISEDEDGALAVHCLAGLGRTGTLIAMYMMKHMGFTANECIAWLRIVRPGSIIGPQQQYLKDQEARMWDIGSKGVKGLGLDGKKEDFLAPGSNQDSDAKSLDLAQQITKGMHMRDQGRCDDATHTQGPDHTGKLSPQTLPRQVQGVLSLRPSIAHRSSNLPGSCGTPPAAGRRASSIGVMSADYLDAGNNGGATHSTRFMAVRPDATRRSAPVFSSPGHNVLGSSMGVGLGGGGGGKRGRFLPHKWGRGG